MGVLPIGGIASGIDTESMIKKLMALERKPFQALQQRRDTMTTQANAWRDLNTRLLTLQKRVTELQGLTDASYMARRGTPGDATVASVTSTTSSATLGTYSVDVVKLAKNTVWQQGSMSIAAPDTALGIAGVVKVDTGPKANATFTVAATDSLNAIAKKINDNSAALGFSAGVMQIAPGDYRLVLSGQNGTANDFTLADGDANNAATGLQLVAASATRAQTADNGQIKVNGVSVVTADSTVTDAIGGVTLNVAKVGSTTITVAKDYSPVIDAVKKVVDQYNSVMDLIDQQTKYDSKTKQGGALVGDNRVKDIAESLRRKLFSPVEPLSDEVQNLQMLGVSTEAFKVNEKPSRKLVFDSAKLIATLDKNPLGVRQLVVREDTSAEPAEKNQGIATRLVPWLDNYTKAKGILEGQASAIDKGAELLKSQMTRIEEQILPMREKRLRAQFVAMEKAMKTLQNQGDWLSGQLKSLPGFGS